MMGSLLLSLKVATFSVILLPACVAVIRNAYAEAVFMGATTFISYIDKAGLTKILKDTSENVTVLAPTNVAFSQLPASLLNRLDTDDAFCKEVLSFHVCKGVQTPETNNQLCPTLNDYQARFNIYTKPSISTVSGSEVLKDDNLAINGKVVVLRKVMYPLPTTSALSFISGDNFDLLLLALSKAGLTDLFKQPDVTVFAPTNQAFQSLPPGVFSDLLDNVTLLKRVLQYHVVNDVVYSAYVVKKGGAELDTVNGQSLNVTVTGKDSTLTIGKATVTDPDQNVSNGVVHVIDQVLLPA